MFGNWGSDENYCDGNTFWAVTTIEPQPPVIDPQSRAFTIPDVNGLEYVVDDAPVEPGTYTTRCAVTIHARALTGYRLAAECEATSWQLHA